MITLTVRNKRVVKIGSLGLRNHKSFLRPNTATNKRWPFNSSPVHKEQILVLGSSWFSLLGHCSGEERLKSSTDNLQSRNFLIKELCPVAYRGDHQGGELHQVLRLLWLRDQQLKPRLKATQQRIFTTKDWSQELLDVSHTSAPIPKTAEDLRKHLDYFVTIFPAEVRI